MPIYEYVCTNCSHHLEALQKVNEAVLTTCPQCEGETLMKGLFSAPNFQLKGKGWYKTDYAKVTPDKVETKAASKVDTKTSESL